MFRLLTLAAALAIAAPVSPSLAKDERRTERVKFDPGTSGAIIRDRIKGYETVRYVLGARAGQRMLVELDTKHSATYFNVLQPSQPDGPALAMSEMSAPGSMVPDLNRFDGVLPENGDYVIEVYMVRAAARRGETARFTLDVEITADNASAAPSNPSEFNATGTIPCATNESMPMSQCDFGVIRRGGGDATVVITMPDGGQRYVYFEGDDASSDASGRTVWERRGDLNMISIGRNERYEIPDAVRFGG